MRRSTLGTFVVFPAICLACAVSVNSDQQGRLVSDVCPSAHEIESIQPMTVANLRGVVLLEIVGNGAEPLPDVRIYLASVSRSGTQPRDHSTRSGSDGSFAIQNASKGRYYLVVCKEGFVTLTTVVTVTPNARNQPMALKTRLDW